MISVVSYHGVTMLGRADAGPVRVDAAGRTAPSAFDLDSALRRWPSWLRVDPLCCREFAAVAKVHRRP
jgi:hypothetical protein